MATLIEDTIVYFPLEYNSTPIFLKGTMIDENADSVTLEVTDIDLYKNMFTSLSDLSLRNTPLQIEDTMVTIPRKYYELQLTRQTYMKGIYDILSSKESVTKPTITQTIIEYQTYNLPAKQVPVSSNANVNVIPDYGGRKSRRRRKNRNRKSRR